MIIIIIVIKAFQSNVPMNTILTLEDDEEEQLSYPPGISEKYDTKYWKIRNSYVLVSTSDK